VPTSGRVRFRDHDLSHEDDELLTHYRREHVGFVFQFYNLIPSLTAWENVALVTDVAERPMDAGEALARVGLAERRDHYPSQLSGGEQQRVAIARALAQRPAVILADEPTASLDPALTSSIMDILRTINREQGLTLVVSQHQLETALAYASRIVGFRRGKVAFDGPPAAVTPAVVREIYDE
jgi:putative ABC transport system ATP-binding protein